MSKLPEITILNVFLEEQRKLLKARAKDKSRKFADVRKAVMEDKLFKTLRTDTGFNPTFHDGYVFELLQAKSIYQFYRVLENIQLNHTARMSGKAIAAMF